MVIWQKDTLADITPSCTLLPSIVFNRAWPGPMVLVHQKRNYLHYLKRKGQLFCSRFWGWEEKNILAKINKLWNVYRDRYFSLQHDMSIVIIVYIPLFIFSCINATCDLHIFKVSRREKNSVVWKTQVLAEATDLKTKTEIKSRMLLTGWRWPESHA